MAWPRARQQAMTLEDQVAIVTGASSGIGEGIARALAERASRLVLDGRGAAVAGDIGDPTTPRRLIDHALEHIGRLAIDNTPDPDRPARPGAVRVGPRRR
jgi:NAD(P)-dependent dehydrogenase (short-subunit alcohol dehydrogenase family)